MRKMTVAALAIAVPFTFGLPMAIASDDVRCSSASKSEWRSIDEVRAAAQALGYRDVRKIKADDGCYEAYAFDKNNRRVEIYMDPVTLKVVRVEPES